MRYLAMAVLFLLAATPALAEVETLAGAEGDVDDGGFGAPVLTLTQIDGEFAVLAGGRGELNVSESVRLCFGAGYRYVGGLDLEGLGDSDLSGPTATLTLKFGEF